MRAAGIPGNCTSTWLMGDPTGGARVSKSSAGRMYGRCEFRLRGRRTVLEACYKQFSNCCSHLKQWCWERSACKCALCLPCCCRYTLAVIQRLTAARPTRWMRRQSKHLTKQLSTSSTRSHEAIGVDHLPPSRWHFSQRITLNAHSAERIRIVGV